jgi:prepilin-type N-terminal cleavage/methylation domain-containing protein
MGPIARARLSRSARARAAAEGGFTLIELLISMVILVIVMTSLTSVLVSASHTEIDLNKRFQAQVNDRTGLVTLRHEIHCANAVTDTSGSSLTPGTAYSAITVTLGGNCPTAVSGSTTYATWCTSASTLTSGDWALYRVTSTSLPRPTCGSAGAVKWVDYITTPLGAVFCLPDSSTPCGPSPGVLKPANSLPLLYVALPVNLNGPGSTTESYNLVDVIALKNGARS